MITPLLHVSPQAINGCFSERFAFVFFKELESWVQEGRQSKRHGTLCEVPHLGVASSGTHSSSSCQQDKPQGKDIL